MKTIILAAAALALTASMATAQETATKQTFMYLTPDETMAKITASENGQSIDFTPQNKNHDFFEILDRKKTTNLEIHETSADYITVIGGAADVTIGGTVPDAKETHPGEMTGSKIVGGKVYALKTGSVMIIPAGTPHWFSIPEGGHLLYTIVKHPDTMK